MNKKSTQAQGHSAKQCPPYGTVARHTPQSRKHWVFWVAAEIIFCLQLLSQPPASSCPFLRPFSHSPLPASLFSQSPPCLPFLTVPSLHPFSHSPLPASLFSQSPSCIPFLTVPSLHPFSHSPLPASLFSWSPSCIQF